MSTAQIHRFGDCVAMYLGSGETVYLTPKEAKNIAKALNDCAKDVSNAKYINGVFETIEFTLTDTGYNGREYKYKREE